MKGFLKKTLTKSKSTRHKMSSRSNEQSEQVVTRQVPPPPHFTTQQQKYNNNDYADGYNNNSYHAASSSPSPPPPAVPPRTFIMEDIDNCINKLVYVGRNKSMTRTVCLDQDEILAICRFASNIFLKQPTLLELSPGVKVVGDVHGQYTDLMRLFEACGFPPSANYLFLGDYVDRGMFSLETILLLLCYKIKYPENFFLLRGNHESADVTRVYGFYDECKRRLNVKIWKTFIDVFNTMPIAAIIASKIFCVHGGLSPSLHSLEQIYNIQRPLEIPEYGFLNDLLWSDPNPDYPDWSENDRGVSVCFGKKNVMEFLAKHQLELVCRAHMVVEDGYQFEFDRSLVTVFSAPNYCGEFDNYGAVMTVSEDLLCSFELVAPEDQLDRKKNKRISFQIKS